VVAVGLLAPALAGILLGLSNLSTDGGIDHAGVLVPLPAGVLRVSARFADLSPETFYGMPPTTSTVRPSSLGSRPRCFRPETRSWQPSSRAVERGGILARVATLPADLLRHGLLLSPATSTPPPRSSAGCSSPLVCR